MANWFITGAGSGLGHAVARAAIAQGDTVVGTVRSAAAAGAVAALSPDRAHPLPVDLTDEAAVIAAVAEAERLTGGIDIVVNNAGYGLTGAIEETGLDQARALFEVNLFAPMAVMKAALPYLRARRRGHIVNMTSVSGLAAWAGTAVYGASKFALECLGRTLAQEVAPLGIRVTNVAPGGLRTGFSGTALVDADGAIPDYADTAHRARPTLTAHAGAEPNDPDRAAQAILAVVASPKPPLLLLLGADALGYVEREFAALESNIARWMPLTRSVACTDADGLDDARPHAVDETRPA